MELTCEMLAEAAYSGTGVGHLSPGKVWAAHYLKIPPWRLSEPLSPAIAVLLERTITIARRRFFEGLFVDQPGSLIARAFDDRHPVYLRRPIQQWIIKEEFRPYLKSAEADDESHFV